MSRRPRCASTTGSHLKISTPWDDAWTYELGGWHTPQTPPRVLQYWHHVSEWTCSHSDALMLQTDEDTAAYRVTWTPGNGPKREFVMPARAEGGRSALELGKIDCSGESLSVEQLAAGGHLELTAIRLDRSEVAVTGLPYIITTASLGATDAGLDRAFLIPTQRQPTTLHVKPIVAADSALGLVVLLVFVGGLFFAIRRALTAAAAELAK